jgi:hypothetical protein
MPSIDYGCLRKVLIKAESIGRHPIDVPNIVSSIPEMTHHPRDIFSMSKSTLMVSKLDKNIRFGYGVLVCHPTAFASTYICSAEYTDEYDWKGALNVACVMTIIK